MKSALLSSGLHECGSSRVPALSQNRSTSLGAGQAMSRVLCPLLDAPRIGRGVFQEGAAEIAEGLGQDGVQEHLPDQLKDFFKAGAFLPQHLVSNTFMALWRRAVARRRFLP